jgi:hypothetical protein
MTFRSAYEEATTINPSIKYKTELSKHAKCQEFTALIVVKLVITEPTIIA